MDDKNAARRIASIFGRSCREPSNDPGLDPALDAAAEVIARIHAEARAEALKDAADSLIEIARLSAYLEQADEDEGLGIGEESRRIRELASSILADEPKEERGAEGPQVHDKAFHRQMLLAFQDIRRKRRDEGMTEWADGDMAAWVMDRLPSLRSSRAEVECRIEEAGR